IETYDVYQHMMDYWDETMQDDCYQISADGWVTKTKRVYEKAKSGKKKGQDIDKGWICDLVPKELIVARYFISEQQAILAMETERETALSRINELEEEHVSEDDLLSEAKTDKGKFTLGSVKAQIKLIFTELEDEIFKKFDIADKNDKEAISRIVGDFVDSMPELMAYLDLLDILDLMTNAADLKKKIASVETDLDQLAYDKYPELSEAEIKALVVDDKWLSAIDKAVHGEMNRINQALTVRVKELAERYETPLPKQSENVVVLEAKVNTHLEAMGFVWK
ncbi:MAG: hypothetical protein V3U84_10525, partial [Thiotrichaceae bacterium]